MNNSCSSLTLTEHEFNIISNYGIRKCNELRLLIIQYKKQDQLYNLSKLLQLSRKNLAILRRQIKNQEGFEN